MRTVTESTRGVDRLPVDDPWRALCAGVLVQAVKDIKSGPKVRRWDALLWMANPNSTARLYFDVLGFEDDPLACLRRGFGKGRRRPLKSERAEA